MAKVIKTGILHRAATVKRDAINSEKRTVELAFSSELPVERYFGNEILDHSPASVDLSRLSNSAPLLMDHNTRDQVGVVESATVGNDKIGRAVVRFGNSQRAQEIFKDVQDGIRSLISVGYRVNTLITEKVDKGVETMRATSWTPMEISLVSIPADPTVGVGRAGDVDDKQFETRVEPLTEKFMEPIVATPLNQAPAPAPTPGLELGRSAPPKHLISERVQEIRAIVDYYKDQVPGLVELGRIAEIGEWPLERFRDEVQKILPQPPAIKQTAPLDLKPRDIARYSLCRAIAGQLPNGRGLSGIEKELSDEIQSRHGKAAEGFWLPAEVLTANMQRSFIAGTGTLGGMLVQTSNMGSEFIEVLRNKAQVMALGARSLMLSTPVTIPRRAAAGTANWVGETVSSTMQVGNFEQITLTPKGISAYQQYAKQLLITNDPSIDSLVRDDITQIIGLAIDLAALHGTGTTQPTGIIGTTGIGSVLIGTNGLALGNATAYPAMVSLETMVSSANADVGSLAYLMRPAARGALRIAQRFSSTDSPVWTNGGPFVAGIGGGLGNGSNDGLVNGYRAAVTSQISNALTTGTATTVTSPVFFGNWNELILGHFNGGATDIIVDPYTAGASAVVRIYARHWVDIGVRHGASFAVLGGVLSV